LIQNRIKNATVMLRTKWVQVTAGCRYQCIAYAGEMHSLKPTPFDKFERIEIINLPSRRDRRRAVTAELLALGTHIDETRTSFLPAERPKEPGEFDTIGARGCFLSHLAALEKAKRDNVSSLLILEDDVAFSASERSQLNKTIETLNRTPWDIFYGGSPVDATGNPLTKLAPDKPALLAHFIAFSKEAIDTAVPYLQAMLERPAGSADGGPMHVDGAYSWLRRANPHLITFAATPAIAHQRSSATDIHVRRGFDRVPILRGLLNLVRALKNWRRSRY
jgi:glycosyl transferase family 25